MRAMKRWYLIAITAVVLLMISGVAVYKATMKLAVETSEETKKAQIEGLLAQAKTFRDQAYYRQAYTTLKKAQDIDANDDRLKSEISATDKACNAEKTLGIQKDLDCSLASLQRPITPEKPPPTTGAPGRQP